MLKWKTTQRRNKFGAVKTRGLTSDTLYASKAEMNRAEVLKKQEQDGEITDLVEQPKVHLSKYHSYKPDFGYTENGRRVFEDVKGAETDRFRINMNLWRERGPGVLRVSKRQGKYGKWQYRDIHPDTYDETMWSRA